MPDYISTHYPEVDFGGYTNVDGSVAFFCRVHSLLQPDFVTLDVGCGQAKVKAADKLAFRRKLFNLRRACSRVIGIDPSRAGESNPLIDEFRRIEDFSRWPVESASVDLLIADFVLEHVGDPDDFFAECNRVLKTGGYLCLRTPNALSYFGLVSRVVPNRFHARVAGAVQDKRQEEDVFPTLYRCNTRRKLRRALGRHGFQGCVLSVESEPAYFSFSHFLFWLGVLHQRMAPRWFRLTLMVFARKLPPEPSGQSQGNCVIP